MRESGCAGSFCADMSLSQPAMTAVSPTYSVCKTASRVSSANMAALIAQSTSTTGLPFARVFPPLCPLALVGGGRSNIVNCRDLQAAVPFPGEELQVLYPEYTLIDYVSMEKVPCPDDREEGTIVCKLPLSFICSKLSVSELRDLARLHGLHVTTRHVRPALLVLLNEHMCADDCEQSYAVLQPLTKLNRVSKGLLLPDSPEFAKAFGIISVEDLDIFLTDDQKDESYIGFRVKRVLRAYEDALDPGDICVRDPPLAILAQALPMVGLRSLAAHHGVNLPVRWSRIQCMQALQNHACNNCISLHYVLTPVKHTGRKKRKPGDWLDVSDDPYLWQGYVEIPTASYPPRPTTLHDIAVAMKGYCAELAPSKIVQAGCCVCGVLHCRAEMQLFVEAEYDLTLLEEPGCTRLERQSITERVQEMHGPVLDRKLEHICLECDRSLRNSRRPKMALANHLWVGDVPECLKDLTLGECALIARVRHNQCVVRVSQGHAKMVANVIAFEHPSKKIYDKLPMRREDVSEVLAVLYTGVDPPTEDDLKRTPVLVRRNRVRAALEWLRLNHKDYADLTIDYDALETYELEGVPIGLLRKEVVQDGNILAAAKSVFDPAFEEGTNDGMCPYTVSGLTAERHTVMTSSQRKVAGLLHLKNGGNSLAVGHDSTPQSIWNNPSLYPRMFPWLFPYGLGGLEQDHHCSIIGREVHLRSLLMYHDKRFQRDAGFLIVQMNHQLIRQGSTGSFIAMKRGNFGRVAGEIDKLDPGVLRTIIERLINGGRFFPKTPEERRVSTLMDQIDVVGSYVDGSLAKKKFQRGEIWSLINFLNAPNWFITISPADQRHPLCIHWASNDAEFRPEIKSYKERQHLVTRNPVACAQFFHHLVTIFIKHICGWSEDGVRRGLFGEPDAFYGTVEEQGRKSLHLHFLLWIQCQMPLHVVREKLMSEDSEFQREITEYIESCVVGEFFTGSKDEIAASVPDVSETEDRGIHTILSDKTKVPEGYSDPTMTMPEAPPDKFCDNPEDCRCEDCLALLSWWERYKLTFDDLFVRSNVHACWGRKDNKSDAKDGKGKQSDKAKVVRQHATGKGCLNSQGVCTARFPRETFMQSCIDKATGHLNIRKREADLNDVNSTVTFAHRCNTDCRCLLSGTSVKAVVGYVTDYVSKAWLKTHQVFQAAYDSFSKHQSILDDTSEGRDKDRARRMIMKVVNSLSSKMEIGGPMAALYLLGNPDHYASHQFVKFYWKNYVNFVESQWTALLDAVEPQDGLESSAPEDVGIRRVNDPSVVNMLTVEDSVRTELGVELNEGCDTPRDVDVENHGHDVVVLEAVGVVAANNTDPTGEAQAGAVDEAVDNLRGMSPEVETDSLESYDRPQLHGESEESVRMTKSRGRYYANSNTDDYRFRPQQHESVCLYDFVQCSIKHGLHASRSPRRDLRWFQFSEDHPQFSSTAVALDPDRTRTHVPNFLGPSIPRKDEGNREEYCCAMLTLFCPWRTGIDLKSADITWEQAFNDFTFTRRQREIMTNFNMRYECYDARDDYGAILRSAAKDGTLGLPDDDEHSDSDSIYADNGENGEDEDELVMGVGTQHNDLKSANFAMVQALRSAGWLGNGALSRSQLALPNITLDQALRATAWNNIIRVEKMRAWRRKIQAMGTDSDASAPLTGLRKPTVNDARVVPPQFISKDFVPPSGGWAQVMVDTIRDFSLNVEQEKAFRIIANHACCIDPDQLLMHLGGMGGTGKSTVIKALCSFFKLRNEEYRFVLLGPTGTSAALIGGSTYHTFLGINTAWSKAGAGAKVEEVRERLIGVGYILLDEHSMLDCRALCAISARCCEAVGCFEKPFGGLNVILCGDFAQLPPVVGRSLYNRNVQMQQTARQTVYEQENTIGKHIWLQFTTVVILTENMRQTAREPEEIAFRKALENLRWHACTPADIALIRTRLAAASGDNSIDAPGFKDVSIITARNRDKDMINSTASARFAHETDQTLVDFFSMDELKSPEPKRRDPKKAARVYSDARRMTKNLQVNLWTQPPCTSEQIPGKLSLCLGMPVLIRYNEATELCMTRGQEARVVGWTALKYPKWTGRKYLDTLYVELLGAPHKVKLPHLPQNVVPLTRNSQTVEAQLPSDEYVCLARSQVPVLPNFAMTDYSAQGKTREWNVIDLTECKNFQGAYTCLSRGTSLSRTLIVRDFPDSLLAGKLDGALRQEYRELAYLSTITDLLYEGVMPAGVIKSTRWDTIATYRGWKSTSGSNVHDAPVFPTEDAVAPPTGFFNYQHETIAAVEKRKLQETELTDAPLPKKRKLPEPTLANLAWAAPAGPLWDASDWSCAYDAWTFVWHGLWQCDRVKWSRILKNVSSPLAVLVAGFEKMRNVDPEQEISAVRNELRSKLRELDPSSYTGGRKGTDIMGMTGHLLSYEYQGFGLPTQCAGCDSLGEARSEFPLRLGPFVVVRQASSIAAYVQRSWEFKSSCRSCGGDASILHCKSDIITFSVAADDQVTLDDRVEVGDWGLYRLAGVIYYGADHFVSRTITPDNKVYVHDGIEGGHSTYEGVLHETMPVDLLNSVGGKEATLVLYAFADRVRNVSNVEP